MNGYRHARRHHAILSKEMKWGVFRTGAWYDWAYTDRYQVPSSILTQPVGHAILPELRMSISLRSRSSRLLEFEWHPLLKLVITAGVKSAVSMTA